MFRQMISQTTWTFACVEISPIFCATGAMRLRNERKWSSTRVVIIAVESRM
ncbi:MAG: hypothetical protein M0D55_05150 [Elusimicrobiota bacterium]|nr:MAG: hypothetical protein M0D55_05150 [Elusimicrobiota bacterium]